MDAGALIPDLAVDLRYFSGDNFVGGPIPGYEANRAVMTLRTAEALAEAQRELRPLGLGLLIFDAYRPQQAVDRFTAWAADLSDRRAEKEHYPDVPKSALFKQGYIAKRSGHSRGSAVDLTIYVLDCPKKGTVPEPRCLTDMGTGFDFFGPAAHYDGPGVTPRQRAERRRLRTLMIKHGFKPYEKEWWHFTLADEPFPTTYFTFPVR